MELLKQVYNKSITYVGVSDQFDIIIGNPLVLSVFAALFIILLQWN